MARRATSLGPKPSLFLFFVFGGGLFCFLLVFEATSLGPKPSLFVFVVVLVCLFVLGFL